MKTNKRELFEVKNRLVSEYIKTLNPRSKFYSEDIYTFTHRLKSETSITKLQKQLNNLLCVTGQNTQFNKEVNKEVEKMKNSGMFYVNDMSVNNALD